MMDRTQQKGDHQTVLAKILPRIVLWIWMCVNPDKVSLCVDCICYENFAHRNSSFLLGDDLCCRLTSLLRYDLFSICEIS